MASTTFTYAILTGADTVPGSIKQWANSGQIPADQILEEAQQWIYARLRVREMIYSESVSIAEGASEVNYPVDFQDPLSFKLDGDQDDLDYVQENLLGRTYDDADHTVYTGRPQRWAVFDGMVQFDVAADDAYTGRLVYYGTPPLLSGSVQTNFLTDRYGFLLRKACLALAYDHRKRMDEAKAEFLLAEGHIAEVNMLADMGRRGQILR